MRVEILKSIAGTGDIVEGSRREFGLDVGMVANVEDRTAANWIASGIARSAEPATDEPHSLQPVELNTPETTSLTTPEKAIRKRPSPRTRGKRRP